MTKRHGAVARAAGFTLIETLVVLLVAIVLLLMSYPEILKYYVRTQLEGATRQAAVFVQRMRYEAIRTSQPARVCLVTSDTPDAQKWIVASSAQAGPLGNIQAPVGPALFFGCASVPAVGPDATDLDEDPDCFVLLPDGSVAETGVMRFSDPRGNCLEVQVEPQATARVQVRKWDEADQRFYARNEGGKAWTWNTGDLF